jgi:hypothetical protein
MLFTARGGKSKDDIIAFFTLIQTAAFRLPALTGDNSLRELSTIFGKILDIFRNSFRRILKFIPRSPSFIIDRREIRRAFGY